MEEEEHEVYGGEIPDEGEMEGDMDSHAADVDMSAADDDAVKVLLLFLFLIRSKTLAFGFRSRFGCMKTQNWLSDWLQELDEMKKRLKEMEEEAAALREMQAKVEKEMGAVQGSKILYFTFMISMIVCWENNPQEKHKFILWLFIYCFLYLFIYYY